MTDEKDIDPIEAQDPAQESTEPATKAAPAKKAPAKKPSAAKAEAAPKTAAKTPAAKTTAKADAPAAAKKAPAKKAPAKAAAKSDDAATEAPAKKAPAKKAPAKKAAAASSTEAAAPTQAPRPRRTRGSKPTEKITVRAHAKYIRSSARKARLVCDHIREQPVDKARAILDHSPRSVARDWSKLLESAVANAEHNHALDADDLKIIAVFADEGPTLKRFQPRAQGRAFRIRKRTTHLTILLGSKE